MSHARTRQFAVSGVLLVILVALVVTPIILRPEAEAAPAGAERLIVITPHNQQIRIEFERAFSAWHERNHGTPVDVDYRRPGGTSEIRKQILAIYESAVRRGDIGPDGSVAEGVVMPYDLLFGGGTYEHGQMKRGVTVTMADGEEVRVPVSVSLEYSREQLDEWFGENRVGAVPLYDEEQHWLGVALSSFGILFNRDVLEERGLPMPRTWHDLADYRYFENLALGDPRQSGSVATTYESILNNHGWEEGWRILRAMAANARYFANDSKKVVLDVSHGEAAAGVAIDFYGRFQAQAVREPGESPEESRLGYIDPAGAVYVDPDPISILRGGRNPELARRFLEFVLTEEGQAIWQLPATGADAPPGALGPEEFELRRMPIRRVMYEKHFDRFIDKSDPYEAASTAPGRGWRSMLGPLFGAFAIDVHHEMKEAWEAMNEARARGADDALVAEMESLFHALPEHTLPDGTTVEFVPENYRAIRDDWRDRDRAAEHRIEYSEFFRSNYRRIVELAAPDA